MEDRLQHQPTALEPQRARTNRVCSTPQEGAKLQVSNYLQHATKSKVSLYGKATILPQPATPKGVAARIGIALRGGSHLASLAPSSLQFVVALCLVAAVGTAI